MLDAVTPFTTSVKNQYHGILKGLFHQLDRTAYGFALSTRDWGGQISFPDLPHQMDGANCGTMTLFFLWALLKQGKGLFQLKPHPVGCIPDQLKQLIPMRRYEIVDGGYPTSLCLGARSYWYGQLEKILPTLPGSGQEPLHVHRRAGLDSASASQVCFTSFISLHYVQ